MKKIIILILIPWYCLAANADIFAITKPETLKEEQQGNEFLQLFWQTELVIEDVEINNYFKKLGHELVAYSEGADKHFDFFLLDYDEVNAFAGIYGYIGMYTGMFIESQTEAEIASILAHEISHVTQNHLQRFNEKTGKQLYVAAAGILASLLFNNSDISQAIITSAVAGAVQNSLDFSKDHEWEADRIGMKILAKSGFDPQTMASFFFRMQVDSAEEFLLQHPSGINRISDIIQRASRYENKNRKDSFEYLVAKARLYYDDNDSIKSYVNQELRLYMQAYQALEQQLYQDANKYIKQLLKINNSLTSNILAGRIASKLGNINTAVKYFSIYGADDEPSTYYTALMYLENNKANLGITVLKKFLQTHKGGVASYGLLSRLYISVGKFAHAHIANAESLILKGKLNDALNQYKRAQAVTKSTDLLDILKVKIEDLEKTIDVYFDIA